MGNFLHLERKGLEEGEQVTFLVSCSFRNSVFVCTMDCFKLISYLANIPRQLQLK